MPHYTFERVKFIFYVHQNCSLKAFLLSCLQTTAIFQTFSNFDLYHAHTLCVLTLGRDCDQNNRFQRVSAT